MWNRLDKPWQEAIALAWEAYKNHTIPIGAVILDKDGNLVSKGRNQIFGISNNSPLAGTYMAHAEMNALLNLKAMDHPNVRTYILYTTMEPCPMCFGATVMMNIRNICFGARDGFAGATELNNKLDYISSKKINIKYVGGEIEAFQLILQSAFEFGRNNPRTEEVLNGWRKVNNVAIELGKEFNDLGYFSKAAEDNKPIDEIFNEVINRYLEIRTCPLCGQDNGCTHNKDCWCYGTTIPKGILDLLPEDKKGKACICKSCVDKYKGTLDMNSNN